MRKYNFSDNSSTIERIICAASYLTMGLAGFVYLIICALQRRYMQQFLKYHVFQSIFISVILTLFGMLWDILYNMLQLIPFISGLVNIIISLLSFQYFPGFTVINLVILTFVLYCSITSLMGKYSYLPWISDNIRRMI